MTVKPLERRAEELRAQLEAVERLIETAYEEQAQALIGKEVNASYRGKRGAAHSIKGRVVHAEGVRVYIQNKTSFVSLHVSNVASEDFRED